MDAILSIDAGTTGITALVVDGSASIIAQGYREYPQHFPADGWVEHDLSEMWSATLAAAREALAATDATIVAIGITNQRETVCFWDRETLGSPRRAIVWQDRRTAAMCGRCRVHIASIAKTPAARVASKISSTSASLRASAFSMRTCLPA